MNYMIFLHNIPLSGAYVAIDHQPLTALKQWKASRHRLLWVAVVNHNVGKRDALD